MPPSPYEGSSGIKFRTAHSSAYVREQFRVATSADTRRFDDFCARTFKKTWGFGSPEPFRRAEKRAEWAFMNDQDPDNRIEARWSSGSFAPCSRSFATAWARACPKSRRSGL